jgi:two-component system, cell cycle response regulator
MSSDILLIDDDRFARRIYGDQLEAAGHRVDVAATGEEGLDRLRAGRYDLVVTDVILPGMDGLQVLAEARRIDPDVGVIMITALDMVDPAVRAIKAGAFDYLVKPITPETLQLAVARCVEHRSLLWENIDLKRHLSLSQAGARIASAGERDPACHEAAEALARHVDAVLTLVVAHDGEKPAVHSAVGSGIPLDPTLVTEIADWIEVGDGPALSVSAGAPEPLRRLGAPTVLPVPSAGDRVSVLIFPGERKSFPDASLRAAHFLIRHLGQSLEALGRLEAARHLAYVDDLTQLFNGRYLHRILERYVDTTRGGGSPFAVLFLDLDRFKAVNDAHGHLVGSELLVEVAKVLKTCIRDRDTAVRYGGDEYVVVLPESDQGGALKVAERIRRCLEEHVFMADRNLAIRLTASVGVACYPEHTTDKRRLVELADHAMYRGKRSTRNVVYLAALDGATA